MDGWIADACIHACIQTYIDRGVFVWVWVGGGVEMYSYLHSTNCMVSTDGQSWTCAKLQGVLVLAFI